MVVAEAIKPPFRRHDASKRSNCCSVDLGLHRFVRKADRLQPRLVRVASEPDWARKAIRNRLTCLAGTTTALNECDNLFEGLYRQENAQPQSCVAGRGGARVSRQGRTGPRTIETEIFSVIVIC